MSVEGRKEGEGLCWSLRKHELECNIGKRNHSDWIFGIGGYLRAHRLIRSESLEIENETL